MSLDSGKSNEITKNDLQHRDFIDIDFIEMLTLDANEFLRTKCVCKESSPTFCNVCFSGFNKHTCEDRNSDKESAQSKDVIEEENNLSHQNIQLSRVESNKILSTGAKISCESEDFNKGLLNGSNIGGELPINENNDGRHNKYDEMLCNCDLVKKSTEEVLKNSVNESDVSYSLLQGGVECPIEAGTKFGLIPGLSNISCYEDCGSKSALTNCNKKYIFEDKVTNALNNKKDKSCSCRVELNQNPDQISENACRCSNTQLIISNSIRQDRSYMTELTNNENSINTSDFPPLITNLSPNLDPKNASHPTSVLQDLLNPASTGPNSSETAPSRHQQESAHGESCASHTSIEADGRWREQAPRCSRESAADVGANDALRRRISQDNITADNFLTETQSGYRNSCFKTAKNACGTGTTPLLCGNDGVDTRVAKERRQQLSWGFRNGRLVFAESKSDLDGSRLQPEQVVGSAEGPLKATTKHSGKHLAESPEQLSTVRSDCCAQEATDKQPSNDKLRSSSIVGNSLVLTQNSNNIKNQTSAESAEDQSNQCKLLRHPNLLQPSNQDKSNHQIAQVADSDVESNERSTDGIDSNSSNKDPCQDILYSKDINRRLEDSNSRIKYLEDKLKKAGLIDQNFEVAEVSAKVLCADVNNLRSSQITCTCDELNEVPDVSTVGLDNCKSADVNVDVCKTGICHSCSPIDACSKKIAEISEQSGEHCKTLDDIDKNTIDNAETLIGTLNSFAKNHQYSLEHSFDTTFCTVDEQNIDLTDAKSSIPKYIEYADFQKENSDAEKTSLDSNQNVVKKEEYAEGEELIPEDSHGLCEFNVNNFSGFPVFNANEASGLYDEFIEDSSSEESCDCDDDEEEHFIVIRRMRGDGCTMVNEPDRTKHNPDKANLKSLLKKPGRSKDKKSNRVVFNENKNEFFDADYIILIREECDYDEDDDDGVCTCNQHEMVRLTCCEPNCNCQGYEGFEQTPQSPKFAPPIEFVDAVTLSPPEGYKDMEMMASRGQQRGAVCRECSATHEEEVEEEGEGSQSDSEMDGQTKEQEEKEKTDQSQQTTPTTPPSSESSHNQNYILETITMTTVTQQQILRDAEEAQRPLPATQGSPISGILKGGRLWKQQSQQSVETSFPRGGEPNLVSSDSVTSDDETGNKRSVRFIESEEREIRDSCDGAAESSPEEETPSQHLQKMPIIESQILSNSKQETYIGNSTSPDATEMTLTFKLGNHVLISNNSLKPNSAVRQLFPCTKTLPTTQGVEEENSQQYLVTAESLRAFEEAKRSKLPQIIQSGETDETIKKVIERNTLRRSLIRYEPRSKKQPYKTDNSLVERIKQLTCDVDYNVNSEQNQQESSIDSSDPSEDVLDNRSSPPGEESRQSPDVNTLGPNKTQDKSFSPSSSSSSSSMSLNQNYHQLRKLSASGEQALMMDLKRMESVPDIQNNFRREAKPLPDIGGPHNHDPTDPPRAVANQPLDLSHCAISNKMSSSSITSESRRQFLAPLTACVTMGVIPTEDYYYHLSNSHHFPGERVSVASSGTEYSLDDIDEGLKTEDEEHKRIAPDVLVGTPSASESGDELAMFVQQDAGRIERIKKKYQPAEQPPKDVKTNDEDDEHDDYGFNRRPSVRGIKPRFSTTTEILQQIQNQLQPPVPPPSRVAWPYYSESGLTDNSKQKNVNQNVSVNYQYANVSEEAKTRGYPPQYRPTSLQDENLYQNCANQRCMSGDVYHRPNVNAYSPVVRMGNEYYQSLPVNRPRNGRPQSPPPMDMSKQYHQTMVYIPYNHIEGYQPVQYYHHTGTSDYVSRVSSQNQINKRYVEPVYQSRVHHHVEDHHYSPTMIPPVPPKTLSRVPYPNGQPPPHMMGSRSESPLPGQFSTARSTQTPAPAMSTCGYYPSNPRYRPMVGPVWQGEGNYATKVNRHSFPMVGPRYPPADSISLTDSDSQHSGSLPNGYRQSDISGYVSKDSMPNSPTKPRFIERGVPEGAASVSPQDISGVSQSSSSTMTSPTSPQNPPVPTNQKPMFYAMNV